MKMPKKLDEIMFAPCGMNCSVCYKHVTLPKRGKPCSGCQNGDEGKTGRCLHCHIKTCAKSKGVTYCFACESFPCTFIKNLEKSYLKRYRVSLVKNSETAKFLGLAAFLEQDRKKWTCKSCGGAFSLHDNVCSECGET